MRIHVRPSPQVATAAAAARLLGLLSGPRPRALMVAGGNTPLELYREVASCRPDVAGLQVFVLDEYVGVPPEDARTCSNLLRREVAEAWALPPERFHGLSSREEDALAVVVEHERKAEAVGGLDVVVLGLGVNGHLGFNEPGSARESGARVIDLAPTSVAANREWFGGEHAPRRGATTGMKTLLAARNVLLLAFGPGKSEAVRAMAEGPVAESCPASWLRQHGGVEVYLDEAAARLLDRERSSRA